MQVNLCDDMKGCRRRADHKGVLVRRRSVRFDIVSTGFYLQTQNREWNELTDHTGTATKDRTILFPHCAAEGSTAGKRSMEAPPSLSKMTSLVSG